MKTILSLCIIPLLLTGCELGPANVKICKDDVCVGFTIPAQHIGGKTVVKVQPPTDTKIVLPIQ